MMVGNLGFWGKVPYTLPYCGSSQALETPPFSLFQINQDSIPKAGNILAYKCLDY